MHALLSTILLTLNMFYLKGTAHNRNDKTHYSDICEPTGEQNCILISMQNKMFYLQKTKFEKKNVI